jgi:hypothetical protein
MWDVSRGEAIEHAAPGQPVQVFGIGDFQEGSSDLVDASHGGAARVTPASTAAPPMAMASVVSVNRIEAPPCLACRRLADYLAPPAAAPFFSFQRK